MNIKGVAGNVTARNFEDWIELDSLSWGLDRRCDVEPGRVQQRTFDTPDFSYVKITKQVDQASPMLFSQSCIAAASKTIAICMVQTSDEMIPYLEYTLSESIFTHFDHNIADTGSDDYLLETLFIYFTQISMRYFPRDEKQLLMGPLIAGYDVAHLALL